jgi:hypothetical protein
MVCWFQETRLYVVCCGAPAALSRLKTWPVALNTPHGWPILPHKQTGTHTHTFCYSVLMGTYNWFPFQILFSLTLRLSTLRDLGNIPTSEDVPCFTILERTHTQGCRVGGVHGFLVSVTTMECRAGPNQPCVIWPRPLPHISQQTKPGVYSLHKLFRDQMEVNRASIAQNVGRSVSFRLRNVLQQNRHNEYTPALNQLKVK